MRTSEPVIFLKGVKGAHLDKILKYIYSGSVALSRHQLKPILEVAKSLQVKGLYDANPADILSRQGLTGPSPSGKAPLGIAISISDYTIPELSPNVNSGIQV